MRSPAARADMRLTYDFVLFPDDGKRHEIIDGEHVVSPSPSVRARTAIIGGRGCSSLCHLLHGSGVEL